SESGNCMTQGKKKMTRERTQLLGRERFKGGGGNDLEAGLPNDVGSLIQGVFPNVTAPLVRAEVKLVGPGIDCLPYKNRKPFAQVDGVGHGHTERASWFQISA